MLLLAAAAAAAVVGSSPALVPFFSFHLVVTRLLPLQFRSQVVITLSQPCSKVVTVSIPWFYKYLTMSEHGSYNLVTSLWYKVVTSL